MYNLKSKGSGGRFSLTLNNKRWRRMVFKPCACLCFFCCALFLSLSGGTAAHALSDALIVVGLPDWLEPPVLRSLKAVWSEIPNNANIDRPATLSIVASRLFVGYDVSVALNDVSNMSDARSLEENDAPIVRFTCSENENKNKSKSSHVWDVKLIPPELRGMTQDWFIKDITGLDQEILRLLAPLPAMAMTWADSAFEDRVRILINERLPGWDFSVQIALAPITDQNSSLSSSLNANRDNKGGIILQEQEQARQHSQVVITFRPSQLPSEPMILAIQPSLYSQTLPVMFRSDLEAKLIPALSPLVGVPVLWAERHQRDVENLARAFLEDRNSVSNMRADVNVTFVPGLVSNLSARVDSNRLSFQMWVAAYAGLDRRYPEAGVFFGWNIYENTGLELEFYIEGIVELDDFGLTRRLGARAHLFTLLNAEFWAGGEVSWPGGDWFARVQWGPSKIRRPYLWWRWSPDAGQEGAIGYLFDHHLSLEIYYDGTKNTDGGDVSESKIGLRGILNL